MPFLSITRDKRGYETTALLHVSGGRRASARPRLLYWFRTPPDVRVGVTPLSEAVRRAIEERHRDLSFDWERILSGSGVPIETPSTAETVLVARGNGGASDRRPTAAAEATSRGGRKRRRVRRQQPSGPASTAPSGDADPGAGNGV